jgi:hypothetical protein
MNEFDINLWGEMCVRVYVFLLFAKFLSIRFRTKKDSFIAVRVFLHSLWSRFN